MSIMEIKGVRYSYDNKRNVLKGVSAELNAGKSPNGQQRTDATGIAPQLSV